MTQASDLANSLASALLTGTDFTIALPDFSTDDFQIPVVDLNSPIFAPISRLTNADLTEGDNSLTGSGTFDLLMKGFKAHLRKEFDAGRITGQEYTKAYIAITESAMTTGAQFLATRDATYWAAVTAQLQAQAAQVGVVTARVELESAKTRLQVLRLEALNQQVSFALNKLRLASENVQFDTATYNLANILPEQKNLLLKQIAGQELQNTNLQKQGVLFDDEHALQPKKALLLQEQVESQRAQTLDNRTDGASIVGQLGKQKDLYTQQITSYQRDAEVKVAKIFSDAWITQKTIDEGLLPPDGFTNASLDEILTSLKTNNNLNG